MSSIRLCNKYAYFRTLYRASIQLIPSVDLGSPEVVLLSLHQHRELLCFELPACMPVKDFLFGAFSSASRYGFRERNDRVVPAKNSALRHTLTASPLLSAVSPLLRLAAFVALCANASGSSLLRVRPFRVRASPTAVLWPLLTPAGSAPPPGGGCQVTWLSMQVSPDKNVVFPLMYPPKFTALALGGFGLCCALATYPAKTASNWVRVPRVKRLPLASFRFSLTTDTLAFG